MKRRRPRRFAPFGAIEERRETTLVDPVLGVSADPTRPLLWRRRTPMAPRFELRQDDVHFGEMMPSTVDGSQATGEAFGRSWEVQALSGDLVGPRIQLYDPETREGVVSFRGADYRNGSIRTPTDAFRWRKRLTGFLSYDMLDGRGRAVVQLTPSWMGLWRTETFVHIHPSAWEVSELPELLLLTWFLRVRAESRSRLGGLSGLLVRRPSARRRFRVD